MASSRGFKKTVRRVNKEGIAAGPLTCPSTVVVASPPISCDAECTVQLLSERNNSTRFQKQMHGLARCGPWLCETSRTVVRSARGRTSCANHHTTLLYHSIIATEFGSWKRTVGILAVLPHYR